MYTIVPAIMLFALPIIAEAREITVTGRAMALDGDTLVITGHPNRIRLHAIDTPEMGDWPAGPDARRALDRMINGQQGVRLADKLLRNEDAPMTGESEVTCLVTGTDRHKRDVGICWTSYPAVTPSLTDPEALAQSLNARLLAECHAVTYRTFLAWPPDAITTAFLAAERSCGSRQ
jgi:endonuclease YncB( thermonuclease family)